MNGTRRRYWLVAVVALGWLAGAAGQSSAAVDLVRGACARTPAAALLAAKNESATNALPLAEAHGYRVESIRWDPLLRQSWAVIRSCDHPEQPSMTRLMDSSVPMVRAVSTLRPYAALPIVRAGDMVRLWRSERYAHIEMVAISEENGAVGTRVRVRLATPRDMEGQFGQPQYLAGVVRGPADVEMEP
jgi:hypothetical protein